jgi:hypothetical protein
MQDWEWEVADANRFTEFIDVYRNGGLNEDELFSLMEILVQCVENMLDDPPDESLATLAWLTLRPLLLQRPELHLSTIAYWARIGKAEEAGQFAICPRMRELFLEVNH